MQQDVRKLAENKQKQVRNLEGLGFGDKWDEKLQALSEQPNGTYTESHQSVINRTPVDFQLIFNVKDSFVYLNKFEVAVVNIPTIEHKEINGVKTYDLEKKMRTADLSIYLDGGLSVNELTPTDATRINLQKQILKELDLIAQDPAGSSIAAKLSVKYFDGTQFAENIPNFKAVKEGYVIRNTFPADFYESYHVRKAVNFMYGRGVRVMMAERPEIVEKTPEEKEAEAVRQKNFQKAFEKLQAANAKGPDAKAERLKAEKELEKWMPPKKPEVVRYFAWVQSDLKRNEMGNLFRNQYHKQTQAEIERDGLSFDPEKLIGQYAFKEAMNEKEFKAMIRRIENGDQCNVNWTDPSDGKARWGKISASPRFESGFDLRDENNIPVKPVELPIRQQMSFGKLMEAQAATPIIDAHVGREHIQNGGVDFSKALADGKKVGQQQDNNMGM